MTSVGAYPAVALIAGALCGAAADPPFGPLRAFLALTCVAAVGGWHVRRPVVTLIAVTAGFAGAGAIVSADATRQALDSSLRRLLHEEVGGFTLDSLGPEGDHDPLPTRGVLLEDAAPRDGYVSLRLRVTAIGLRSQWMAADGGVAVSVSGEAAAGRVPAWRAGRIIEAPVSFRRPARYLNDGVSDLERDLALDGTTLFGSVKSGLLVEILERGTLIEEGAADVRVRVRRAIGRWVSVHDAVAGGIVTAVLIGDRTGLPDAVRDRLQEAGTYHVIAISGGNIAILAAAVLGMLMVCGLHGRAGALIAIVALLLYSQVAVAGPSVWRATLMAVIYLAARVLDHRTAVWQAASVAAALLVIAQPLDLRDPGFVLTFGATIALIEGGRRASRLLPARRVLAWVAGIIVASLAVELALLPVSARMFSRVTGAGLLLNLIAVPMMGVAQVAGLIVVTLDAFSAVAGVAGWIAYAAAHALVESARLVEVAPWLAARVPPPGMALVLAYYVALVIALCGRSRLQCCAGAAALVIACTFMVGVRPRSMAAGPSPSALRLTMFDVGQGEALLVEGGGERLQIDAGGAPFGTGSFDIGARVLAPALWARGVHRLDTLLITHGDPDHVGAAALLLEEFAIARVWEGIEVPRHRPSRLVRQVAAAQGVQRELRRAGEVLRWGPGTLRVLHPPEPDWERPRVRNDDSVVLEIRHGDVALLLTGDVSSDVERRIVPQLTPAALRLLKVGHHGSRTSTSRELLDAWQPQIALVSAGRGNTFGHPAPEVLRRLESIGARVFRTDRHGQITVDSDGRTVTVRTFVEGMNDVSGSR